GGVAPPHSFTTSCDDYLRILSCPKRADLAGRAGPHASAWVACVPGQGNELPRKHVFRKQGSIRLVASE
ncbi:unnamed protein product, partial [Laminaria digitata]